MSATILILSFLMLQLSAEAEEMMDPFVLIRQTLKYWLRVYKMYEEEVALGYCWAEYFLRAQENMKNASTSETVPLERWSSKFNRDGRKRYGSISMNSGRDGVRNRRSYGTVEFEPIDIRTDHDRRSMGARKQKRSSSSSRQPDSHGTLLFPRRNKMILEDDVSRSLKGEFKGNRTGDDWTLAGSTGRPRKFLSPEMGQGPSAGSSGFSFLFQFSRPERLKPFDARSVGRVVDLDSRYEHDGTNDRLKVNRDEDDFRPRERQLNSSDLESRSVEQRSSSFRENLRGRREANDRIRGFVWPRSTDERQEISMYSIDSGNRQKNRLFNGNARRTAPTFGLRYTNVRPINARSNIRALSVIPGGIANVPGPFITINPRVLPRNPSFDGEKKRGNNWADENSSKQLPSAGDNRYRRSRHDFLVEKSEAGWNAAVRRPMGSPSLPRIGYPEFMGIYGGWRNSRPNRPSWTEDQGRRSLDDRVEPRAAARTFVTFFRVRDALMGFLRTLGFFVQVGRELMDYVESNAALACTKDYLWGKAVQWIDS